LKSTGEQGELLAIGASDVTSVCPPDLDAAFFSHVDLYFAMLTQLTGKVKMPM
jgi:hypothetical protein